MFQITVTELRRDPDYAIYYNNWTRLVILGIIPFAMLVYFNYKVNEMKFFFLKNGFGGMECARGEAVIFGSVYFEVFILWQRGRK